ncbi:hypothetical protein BT96DRAFT_834786 [Gymnopus androsaceus JB14]|uniref:STAS domain-containing protein n=1 Tax=Gymnopus androsaceus JB14 TaxID=1447944 RepID=A0A6A4GWU7_9AGAR|nr:hypothetical protein BT96DRAFT_834786 [Gymnopus androsaceus JB14]
MTDIQVQYLCVEQLRCLELYGLDKSHCWMQATVLMFHMADMDDCNASACQTIYELIEEYQSRGVGIFITHLHARPLEAFEKAGIVKLLGADAFQENIANVVAKIRPNQW